MTSLKGPFARQRVCLRDEVPRRQRCWMTTIENGCNDIRREETDPQKCRDVVGVGFDPPRGCFNALAGPAQYLFADIKSFDEQIDQRGVWRLRCRITHDEAHALSCAFQCGVNFQDYRVLAAANLAAALGLRLSWLRQRVEDVRPVDLDVDVIWLNDDPTDDPSDQHSAFRW